MAYVFLALLNNLIIRLFVTVRNVGLLYGRSDFFFDVVLVRDEGAGRVWGVGPGSSVKPL